MSITRGSSFKYQPVQFVCLYLSILFVYFPSINRRLIKLIHQAGWPLASPPGGQVLTSVVELIENNSVCLPVFVCGANQDWETPTTPTSPKTTPTCRKRTTSKRGILSLLLLLLFWAFLSLVVILFVPLQWDASKIFAKFPFRHLFCSPPRRVAFKTA